MKKKSFLNGKILHNGTLKFVLFDFQPVIGYQTVKSSLVVFSSSVIITRRGLFHTTNIQTSHPNSLGRGEKPVNCDALRFDH